MMKSMINGRFEPRDPNFKGKVRQSFESQAVMATLNATLLEIDPGRVVIELPYQIALTQQNGFLHGGISATIMDSACGYAAHSLMPADAAVLTVEFKINLLAPARGERFRAVGQVRKPGKNLTLCEADLFAVATSGETLVATMTATLMALKPDAIG